MDDVFYKLLVYEPTRMRTDTSIVSMVILRGSFLSAMCGLCIPLLFNGTLSFGGLVPPPFGGGPNPLARNRKEDSKNMRTLFSLLSISLLLCGCSSTKQLEGDRIPIPDSIRVKSDDIVKSMVGEQFFSSYIRLDSSRSKLVPLRTDGVKVLPDVPHYWVFYRFYIPKYEHYETLIEFRTDLNGSLLSRDYVHGIPQCPNNDCWDTFHVIDKSEALRIAREKGLEDGLNEWKVSLHYAAGDIRDYVWSIQNTLTQSSGKGVIIFASTGKVQGIYGWEATP